MAEALVIEQRSDVALATIIARKGASATGLGAALGMRLADEPAISAGENLICICTGPGTWLACRETAVPGWPDALQAAVGAHAAVIDQTGGYVIFRLSGPRARLALQRGASIDFDPAVFIAGTVAVTMIAHIGVVIWALGDGQGYDVAVFRSFSGSFRRWLDLTDEAL